MQNTVLHTHFIIKATLGDQLRSNETQNQVSPTKHGTLCQGKLARKQKQSQMLPGDSYGLKILSSQTTHNSFSDMQQQGLLVILTLRII